MRYPHDIDADDLKSLSYAIGTDHPIIHSLWRRLNGMESTKVKLPYCEEKTLVKIEALLGGNHKLCKQIRENLALDNNSTL